MTATPLIASTRMYDVAPSAKTAWHALLAEAHRRAGLHVTFVEHGWPTPIGELWARPGLCGAFMCGWPFAQALRGGKAYTAVAAVVPDLPGYEDQARYRSAFLVRDDAPWQRLEDTFGSRYGWMVRDSQSGWNAPRRLLARHAAAHGGSLFQEVKGPYGNPRGLLRALRDGEIDLTAVDGWYLDLLRVHDADALQGLRAIGYTDWTPNPLLVSGQDVDPATSERLTAALLGMHADAGTRELLRAAHVARFTAADPRAYDVLLDHDSDRSYPEIR
ncbi:ABC transporter substrate-binding protein [Bordetella genomosp. 8]|uniref:ABC transporter substrate-binding protein n=1 Tax=Bordetella genomosp. 8 TaxID=1416806 RepID=A0A1W6YM93_9BORD|nr:PhnD/SsuA/transferrin family substrate-binding protein [Bordetella genomosp. 8]ARP82182.1 ABC transporter substrate-binding protein [Bordetella genomosp. 8]